MRAYFTKWLTIGAYLFTPEDSSDTVYHAPVPRDMQNLPGYAGYIKIMFWMACSLLVAIGIAQLQ